MLPSPPTRERIGVYYNNFVNLSTSHVNLNISAKSLKQWLMQYNFCTVNLCKVYENYFSDFFSKTWASSTHPLEIIGVTGDPIEVVAGLHPHAELTGVGDSQRNCSSSLQQSHRRSIHTGKYFTAGFQPARIGHTCCSSQITWINIISSILFRSLSLWVSSRGVWEECIHPESTSSIY